MAAVSAVDAVEAPVGGGYTGVRLKAAAREGEDLLGRSVREILTAWGMISDADWERAEQKSPQFPEEALVELGLVSQADLARARAARWGLPYTDLDGARPSKEAMAIFQDSDVLSTGLVLPLDATADSVLVAISNPDVWAVRDALVRLAAPRRVDLVVAPAPDIQARLVTAEEEGEEPQVSDQEARQLMEAPPVVRLVDQIINRAIAEGASDIHIGNWGAGYEVKYRIDGQLRHVATVPRKLFPGVISRLKVLANLDIAEHRLPQDGEIPWPSRQNRKWDLRIATVASKRAEHAVVRIFGREVGTDLASLGFSGDILEALDRLTHVPNGIILATGPTGSGKTTTLATMVRRIRELRPHDAIYTVEDPVENTIPGAVQIPVNPKAGVTFGRVLRSLLRADPDVILIGEIRDTETAQIAVQAALTGHLVLSTLHTNDAPSAVARLVDLKVEPYLIADTLRAVIAQRLVRKVCTRCGEWVDLSPEEGKLAPGLIVPRERRGRGCSACHGGYRGRTAIAELLVVTPRISSMIASGRVVAVELREASGMASMLEDGFGKVVTGITTVEEVRRVAIATTAAEGEASPSSTPDFDPAVVTGGL
jgi:type IV pilus assembly protein PilB